jgi:oxygen-independent coproporphyrinogen-3 oxidase
MVIQFLPLGRHCAEQGAAGIDKILSLGASNVTVHTFSVKKAASILRAGDSIYSITGGDVGKCVDYSQLRAVESGYAPYYMYRQKNTVGNLENVGFSIEGHEGLYNIYMMEEIQTIFAVGAGAVTKLVKHKYHKDREKETIIKRLFKPKYPYEYLRDATNDSDDMRAKNQERKEEIFNFFSE